MSIGATLIASLLAVLDRPSTWPLALMAFLVRGGWLLVAAPIVVLPTAGGLANVLAPFLEDVAFGRRTAELIGTLAVGAGVVLVWLLGGGLIAAAAEAEAVSRIGEDLPEPDGVSGSADAGAPGRAWRILAVRLAAHVPLALALAWAAWRIVAVGYQELTVPSDVAMPVAWRIALGAPDAFVLVGLTWLIGEAVGAIAARRIVLAGERGRDALRQAVHRSRRMPRRLLAFAAASTLVAVAVIALTAIAAGTAWDALRAAFARGDTSPGTIALLVVFVALFCGGLVLLALTAAWRTAIWTLDVGRSRPGRSGEGAAPGRGTGTVQGGLAT